MANQVMLIPQKLYVGTTVPDIGTFQLVNPAPEYFTLGTNNQVAYVQKFAFGDYNTMSGIYGMAVAFGYNNTLYGANWGGYVFTFGATNSVYSDGNVGGVNSSFGANNFCAGDCNMVIGKANTGYGMYALVLGNANIMTVNSTYCDSSGIIGRSNYMSDSAQSFIAGYQNTIGRNNNYNLVAGQGNTITDLSGANHNAVFGQKNTVNGGDMNLVAGGTATTGHSVTGNNNIVGGGQGGANTVSGYNNCVLGWGSNVAGHDNFVNGQTNTVSGGGNSVVVGRNNVQGGGGNNILVGYGNATNGAQNGIFGEANQANNYSLMYGRQNLCSADYTMAGGHQSHASNYAERALASGWWGSNLHAQTSELVLKASTTDAVVTELSNPAGFLTIQNGIAYTFVVTITAKDTANTDHASYRLEWSTVRGAGVATTTVDGLIKTVIFESQAAWDVNVTADTVNGRPAITVTGEVGKTIHWVARVEITETP